MIPNTIGASRRWQLDCEGKCSNVSSFDAATRERKAEDRQAREALAQDTLYAPIAALNHRVLRSEKSVIHVSGRFCWVKVNGQWLYKTRQIVTGRNKHPARWMLWRPNRRAQILSALRSAKPIRWRIGVKLSLATRPSILAGESSVT